MNDDESDCLLALALLLVTAIGLAMLMYGLLS